VGSDKIVSYEVFHGCDRPALPVLSFPGNGHRCWLLIPRFDVTNEIADDLNLVRIILRDLQPREMVFDHNHQLKAIKPVSPEIINEVCGIGDTSDVYVQMLGNKSPDLGAIRGSPRSRYLFNGR
jgi:hypothetical protein